MKHEDRLDLHNPPPVPMPEGSAPEPKIPADEPPKKEQEKPGKPQKRGGAVVGIVVGVLAAAALLCGYRFVHVWSDPSCVTRAQCVICGAEKGDLAEHTWQRSDECDTPAVCAVCGEQAETGSHDWTGGSCTEPRTCAVCGVYENGAPGHSYADGVCTACGAKQKNEVLKWELSGVYQVGYDYEPETGALTLSAPNEDTLTKMIIVIRDWENQAVSTDRYTVDRSYTAVTLDLPKDLKPGRYSIHAGVQESQVLDFYWGTYGTWMSEDADKWFADFEVKSWKHGKWLARFDTGAPLAGVRTEEGATRFGSPWQMCSVSNVLEDGSVTLMQGGADDKLVVDEYLCISESGAEETAYTFRYENWYLTMDSEGGVYLTDTLTEECLWVITSSL